MSVGFQTARSASNDRLRRLLAGAPVRIVVVVIAFVWTLPTAGLMISSLRPPDDISRTGWWTVFSHPFEASVWTVMLRAGAHRSAYQRFSTPAGTIPGGHPDHHRRLRCLCLRLADSPAAGSSSPWWWA
jgi:hypothetical protein